MLHISRGVYHLSAPISVGANTAASEVRLVGEPSADVILFPLHDVLIQVTQGAPPLTLQGLRLRGRVLIETIRHPVTLIDCYIVRLQVFERTPPRDLASVL